MVHNYLAGGFVGKDRFITAPEDVKRLNTRALEKSFVLFSSLLVASGLLVVSAIFLIIGLPWC